MDANERYYRDKHARRDELLPAVSWLWAAVLAVVVCGGLGQMMGWL